MHCFDLSENICKYLLKGNKNNNKVCKGLTCSLSTLDVYHLAETSRCRDLADIREGAIVPNV